MSVTLFIFDFDDTLFPTGEYLNQKQRRKYAIPFSTPAQEAAISNIEEEVISLFKTCLSQGPVKIVSNASHKWLDQTLASYMVRLSTFIVDNNIAVVSARDEALNGPCGPKLTWKTKVFEREFLNTFENPSESSMVSVGDGEPELYAVQKLGDKYPGAKLVNIRFVEDPSMDALLTQIKVCKDIVSDLPKSRPPMASFQMHPPRPRRPTRPVPPVPRTRRNGVPAPAPAAAPVRPTLMQRIRRYVPECVRVPFEVGRWFTVWCIRGLMLGEEDRPLLPR